MSSNLDNAHFAISPFLYLKSERISQLIGNIFPCLTTKQGQDEMIRARHRSVTLRAHSMGLRNYPSRESHIPSQVERTHFTGCSERKAESAWPGSRSDSNPRPYNASPRRQQSKKGIESKWKKKCLRVGYKHASVWMLPKNVVLIFMFIKETLIFQMRCSDTKAAVSLHQRGAAK